MRRKLKEARQAAGMTQQEVADKLNIGLRYYKMIEAGRTVGRVELSENRRRKQNGKL